MSTGRPSTGDGAFQVYWEHMPLDRSSLPRVPETHLHRPDGEDCGGPPSGMSSRRISDTVSVTAKRRVRPGATEREAGWDRPVHNLPPAF